MRKIRDLPALAVVRLNRFHRRGVRHRQIAEAAEPAKARLNRISVELDGGFYADHVGMVKVEMLGDLQVPVTPREVNIGGGVELSAVLGNLIKSAVRPVLQLLIIEH